MNSKVKKIIGVGLASLTIAAGVMAATQTGTQHNHISIKDTMVVLPTTPVVNDVPLHIRNDMVVGSRLALELYEHTLENTNKMVTKEVNTTVKYQVKSIPITDSDQNYTLNINDFSDLELPENVSVTIDFSKISFNTTEKKSIFGDNAITINMGSSLVQVDGNNYELYTYNNDGTMTIKVFNKVENDEYYKVGQTIDFGNLSINLYDISTLQDDALIKILYNGQYMGLEVVDMNKEYILYYDDSNNKYVFDELNNVNMTKIKENEKYFVVFKPYDVFVGVSGTQYLKIKSTVYKLDKVYKDGDNWDGYKYWRIKIFSPSENEVPFVIVFNPGNDTVMTNKFDIPFYGLHIETEYKTDNNGDITSVHYIFKQDKTKTVTTTVTLNVPDMVKVDPNSVVVPDTYITENGIPSNENVIIIGGPVSNKAWEYLNQTMPSVVNELEKEIYTNGYVYKWIPNPSGSGYIIVVAGKTYKETAEAVDELMKELDN